MNEDRPSIFFHLLAAAIVLPIGLWAKATYAPVVADWIRTFY